MSNICNDDPFTWVEKNCPEPNEHGTDKCQKCHYHEFDEHDTCRIWYNRNKVYDSSNKLNKQEWVGIKHD